MAIVVESQADNYQTTSASVTINKPSGTQEGDLLIAFLNQARYDSLATIPSGWTDYSGLSSPNSVCYYHYFTKVAGASEPNDYTWSEDRVVTSCGIILRISGVDTDNIFHSTNIAEDMNYDTTSTVAALTTTIDGCLLIAAVYRHYDAYIVSGPSSPWTSAYTNDAREPLLGVAYQLQSSAGSTGTVNFTANTGHRCVGVMLAITPASIAFTSLPLRARDYSFLLVR